MIIVTSRDGTRIASDRVGDGPPVILVGGAFQHRAIDPGHARLAELLAPSFTVFNYDRRGRGDSSDAAPYAVDREVEDLGALLAEAGGSRRLAERFAELTSSGRPGDPVELFMSEAGAPAEAIAEMRSGPAWPLFEGAAHTLLYDMAVLGEGGAVPTALLAAVYVPTLVLNGGAGMKWMREALTRSPRALPDARRTTLEGQTHAVDPEVLAPVLRTSSPHDPGRRHRPRAAAGPAVRAPARGPAALDHRPGRARACGGGAAHRHPGRPGRRPLRGAGG